MQMTEKLARHIIWLCGVVEGETGESEDELRNQLEVAFPVLKAERESQAFLDWVWREEKRPGKSSPLSPFRGNGNLAPPM